MTFYAVEDIVPKHPADGVEVRIIHGERMTVAFFTIAGGSGVPEHAHPHEQIGTVLKGETGAQHRGRKANRHRRRRLPRPFRRHPFRAVPGRSRRGDRDVRAGSGRLALTVCGSIPAR